MQIPQEKTNRNYKDSVFVDLFAHDIYAKENFISLYNALHGTNLDAKTTKIQPVMLEKVLYMKSSCKIILQMNQNELNPYVSMLFPDFLYPKIQPKKSGIDTGNQLVIRGLIH